MGDPNALLSAAVGRFESKIAPGPGGCWLWTGRKSHNGYGVFSVLGRSERVHRWSYEYHVGPIPDGLVIDHLCRVRACCNPWHLEPVTGRVNAGRGDNAMRSVCCHGHPFDEQNTITRRQNARPDMLRRDCRECGRQAARRYQARRRSAKSLTAN